MNRSRQNNARIVALAVALGCSASTAVASPLAASTSANCVPAQASDLSDHSRADLAQLQAEAVAMLAKAATPSIPAAQVTDPDVVRMLSRAPANPTQADSAATEAFVRAIRARASPPPRTR
jgi:flagellum-specific peptidoglycan hydrolase FlgJ